VERSMADDEGKEGLRRLRQRMTKEGPGMTRKGGAGG